MILTGSFFFAPIVPKKKDKVAKRLLRFAVAICAIKTIRANPLIGFALFILLCKINSPTPDLFEVMGVSATAVADKGYSPLTSPPFEKGGRKLLNVGCSAKLEVSAQFRVFSKILPLFSFFY